MKDRDEVRPHWESPSDDAHPSADADVDESVASDEDVERVDEHAEHHATTGGAAAVGAVTGGVVGLAGGPLGAAVGAVGGALIGVAAERLMHAEDEDETESEDVETADDESPVSDTSDEDIR